MYQMGNLITPLIAFRTINVDISFLIIVLTVCIILLSVLLAYKILAFTTDEIIAEQFYKKKQFDSSFMNISRNRRTITDFSSREIDDGLISEILEASRIAPTAQNKQPHRIIVIKSNTAKEKLERCVDIYNAPISIIVCVDEIEAHKFRVNNQSSALLDVGVVTTQMMNAANALGLGTAWLCEFDREKMKEEFKLETIEPICILSLGYPNYREEDTINYIKEKKMINEIATII